MTTLTKSTLVLEVVPEESDDDVTSYGLFDDDSGDCLFAVSMTAERAADFGNPAEITVTVEPNDQLTLQLDAILDEVA